MQRVPKSIFSYLHFDSPKKPGSNWQTAHVVCTCGERIFSVFYEGQAAKSIFRKIVLFPSQDGSLAVIAACVKCKESVALFAQSNDTSMCLEDGKAKKRLPPQICPNCRKNTWQLEIELEYPQDSVRPFPNQCQWERISLQCSSCGCKIKRYLDMEID